ncbi:MAG: protein kinase [Anaerolineales bacterium]|jgi:serine/threonine-protein kinase
MWYWNNWRLGKYDLVRKIGSGGMSSVFKAIDRESDRSVAVKVLPPGLDEEQSFKARFEREAKILMRLRHPNIVPILDFGEVDGVYYIVMPLMEVGTLRERINSGPLKPEEGAHIVRQIAEALQYAHDMDLVHRDVKPSNILLDEEGNAWLSDFGTARVLDATANLTGSSLIGTPQYMSPEQARGDPVTPLADVYALGVVLYQMSTGKLPFNAESPLAIAMKHASEPLPHPNAINPNLPEAISYVLIKALEKRPEDRYPSAIALSEAFQAALDDVYDPRSGRLKPGAIKPFDATLEYHPGEDTDQEATDVSPKPEKSSRRSIRIAALLGAIALIPLFWVAARALNSPAAADGGTPTASPSATIDWKATVDALSTAVSFSAGANLSEEQLQTAIASTLQAMVLESGISPQTPTATLPSGNPQTATAISIQTSTAAAIAGGTNTLVPNATSTPSRTATLPPGVTPSITPSPSRTPTAVPSATRTATATLPPTSTNTATATLIPSATSTTRPSSTPTKDVCPQIKIGGFRATESFVEWTISNDTGGSITLSRVVLSWPSPNVALFAMKLDGASFWTGFDDSSPSSWSGSKNMGASARLEADFVGKAASSGYKLDLSFDNGCKVGFNN